MTLCFASLDTTVKFLGTDQVSPVPVLLILWFRYTFQAGFMTVWLGWKVLRGQASLFKTPHLYFQIIRGLLLLSTGTMAFYGLQLMPVAEFTALVMLAPILVTVLSVLILKEHISLIQWMLVLGAMGGGLLILRPGLGLFGWEALFPLGSALCYSIFQLLTSKLSQVAHPLTTHFYTGVVGSACLSMVIGLLPMELWTSLQQTTLAQQCWLVVAGLLGTVGHLLLIVGIGLAPLALLMPFTYSQIAFATLISGWVFGTHPDAWSLVGMSIIALCGAVNLWLRLRPSSPSPAAPSSSA